MPAERGVLKLVPLTDDSPLSQLVQYGRVWVKSETKSGSLPERSVSPSEVSSSMPDTPMLHHGPAPARSGCG